MIRTLADRAFSGFVKVAPQVDLLRSTTNGASLLWRQYSAQPLAASEIHVGNKPDPSFGGISIGHVLKQKADSGATSAALFACRPEDKVFDAIQKMANANVGSILVMKSTKAHMSEVAGVITERDYMRKVAVAGKSSKEMLCAALMTKVKDLTVLSPQDTVVKAMGVMEEKNIRHIPVFDDGKLLGMLSIKDIISTLMLEHSNDVSSMSDYIGGSY